MNGLDLYEERMRVRGRTRRDTALQREQRMILDKMRHSLSYHHALVDDEERDVVIINSDNLDTKMIYALPGEDIRHGAYVDWMNQMWLVIEKDYNTEVYTKAKMQQCNYLLKWVDENHVIHEQWAVIEDGRNAVRSSNPADYDRAISVNPKTKCYGNTEVIVQITKGCATP